MTLFLVGSGSNYHLKYGGNPRVPQQISRKYCVCLQERTEQERSLCFFQSLSTRSFSSCLWISPLAHGNLFLHSHHPPLSTSQTPLTQHMTTLNEGLGLLGNFIIQYCLAKGEQGGRGRDG